MGDLVMLFFAMGTVLLSWFVIAAAMTGLGLLVQRTVTVCLARPEAHAENRSLADRCSYLPLLFWVGYAAAAAALQVWQMLWPIGGMVSLLLLITGLAALFGLGRAHLSELLRILRRHSLATGAFLVFAIWASMHAIGPGLAHDTGMYHYGILQWLQLERIVPGLGNLSLLFAHSPAQLLIGAALDQGPWDGRAQHLLNGLLVFVMGAMAIRGIAAAAGEPKGWINWYDAMLFVPVVMFVLTKELPNPKTDSAPAFLMFMMVRQLIVMLTGSSAMAARDRGWMLIAMGIIGATGVIAKLSTAPLVAAIIPIAAVMWWRGLPSTALRIRTATITAIVGLILIGPWMARNTITSGYPLFPSPIIAVETDWTLPIELVEQEVTDIALHGKLRLPSVSYRTVDQVISIPAWLRVDVPEEEELTRWNWMPAWLITMPAHSPVVCLVPLLLIIGCGVLAMVRSARAAPPRAVWVAAVPLLAALAFWFLTAPTHRFAIGLTWPLAALIVAAIVPARFGASAAARRIALLVLILPGIGAAIAWGIVEQKVRDEPGNPLVNVLFQGPGPASGFHPRPVAETVLWRSRHGVEVLQPVDGRLIWDAPQPAVGWPEELDEDLAYREPGNPRAGFRLKRE